MSEKLISRIITSLISLLRRDQPASQGLFDFLEDKTGRDDRICQISTYYTIHTIHIFHNEISTSLLGIGLNQFEKKLTKITLHGN